MGPVASVGFPDAESSCSRSPPSPPGALTLQCPVLLREAHGPGWTRSTPVLCLAPVLWLRGFGVLVDFTSALDSRPRCPCGLHVGPGQSAREAVAIILESSPWCQACWRSRSESIERTGCLVPDSSGPSPLPVLPRLGGWGTALE